MSGARESSYLRRKTEAEYALQQLRAKGLDALADNRVRQSVAESQYRIERMHAAIERDLPPAGFS